MYDGCYDMLGWQMLQGEQQGVETEVELVVVGLHNYDLAKQRARCAEKRMRRMKNGCCSESCS